MRSMQKARPSTRAIATSDMNEALPSINFVLSTWCSPMLSSGCISVAACVAAWHNVVHVARAMMHNVISVVLLSKCLIYKYKL